MTARSASAWCAVLALRYGSGGTGTASHLSTELLQLQAGISLLHVPYKGTGPGMTALLGGEIQVLLVGLATVLPYVKAKNEKVKVLAVTGAKRAPVAPEIPTVAESGLPVSSSTSGTASCFPAERRLRSLRKRTRRCRSCSAPRR